MRCPDCEGTGSATASGARVPDIFDCEACQGTGVASVDQGDQAPETCGYRESHDPDTLTPLGPRCGGTATQELHWLDGRVSYSCMWHGLSALTDDAKALVARVVALPEGT